MALARLCATFFLLVYFKIACGQQHGLSDVAAGLCLNNNNAGSAQQILLRRAALLSETKNCNQNINGNVGTIPVQQLQNNQAGLLQGNFQANNQLGNCQQLSSLQQAINTQLPSNLQQPATNQNQQACVNQNFQCPQSQNIPQLMGIQNPQKLVVQQQCVPNQSQQVSGNPSCQQFQNLQNNVNLQPQVVQQQQSSTNLNNSPQCLGQSVSPQSDMSLASIANKKVAGLPTQVSQGTLLSHLGIQSHIPALLPNIYDSKQSVNQASIVQNTCPNNKQNGVAIGMTNRPQTSILPSSMASLQLQKECVSTNPTISSVQTTCQNPPLQQQVQLLQNTQQNIVPAHNQLNQYMPMQQQFVPVQNQPAMISAQYQPVAGPAQIQSIPSSVQGQSMMTSTQSHPMQNQPAVQPAQIFSSIPYQSTPQVQSQLMYSSTPIQNNPMVPTQPSPFPASQYPQPTNGIPQYPNNIPGFQNNVGNSKSSSMKQLLPLLFNLLKEKTSCGCHQNQNCGCLNKNNNCGCLNNNNPAFTNQPPQVIGGYPQYVRNVPAVVNTAANMIDSDEDDDDDTVWRLEKYRIYNESKPRHADSADTDEDDEDDEEVEKDIEE